MLPLWKNVKLTPEQIIADEKFKKNSEIFLENAKKEVEERKLKPYKKTTIYINDRAENDSREAYEAVCGRVGALVLSDAEILKNTYAIKFFNQSDYETPEENIELAHQQLAKKRLDFLEKTAEKNAKKSVVCDFPDGKKLDCGHTIYFRAHELSENGTICTDCYADNEAI